MSEEEPESDSQRLPSEDGYRATAAIIPPSSCPVHLEKSQIFGGNYPEVNPVRDNPHEDYKVWPDWWSD
jgi:hypothetical protein